jgi:carbon storage regulator
MLVLSRKVGERIVIGPNIVVTVVAAQQGRVKLGILAPNDVSVHREEVRDRITQQASASGSPY